MLTLRRPESKPVGELFPPLHSKVVMVAAGGNHTVAEDGCGALDTKTVFCVELS